MSKPIEVPPIEVPDAPYPAPYVHDRKVRFGHSDAARIAYTIRLFDYAMEAIEGWFEEVLGNSWYDLNTVHGVGSPFVHGDLDIQAPLRPGEGVAVTVLVEETGRSTVRFRVTGVRGDGVPSFAGAWVCSFIDTASMRSIPIPEPLAHRIAEYRRRCAEANSGAANNRTL
ncbi:acyl-CoA thioesterase [Azospirillum sp.]|uniref:acyl-CoA thioesterase n=1 Tax=Azospirillum sp. TaxID=34012 RepID=UPI002D2629BB|nr:acyl-CoA thioesterase [Azospirillum sp.]HYD69803.1 acyl-CoA thioesterase [Azospirillum sp.]